MANLLEALQQKPQMQDTTSQLSNLLRAKSGKSVGPLSTALSSQSEQAAVAQNAQALQPIQQAAGIQQQQQQQQAREIEQQASQQQAGIQQQRQGNQMQTQLRTDQLLQELEQGRGKVDLQKYQANMEQVGQNLRLSNQQYLDNLQREGNRARLNDDLQFKEQLARSVMEDNKSLLEKQLGNKSVLAVNDRDFAKSMAQMGVKDAWTMFQNQAKTAQEQQMYAGIGGLITSGIGAYGTYAESQDKKAYYGKGGAGENDTSYEASKYRK